MNTLAPAILKCPVCGASFRGSAICSRCRTDLSPLMRVAATAWKARQQARRHLQSGDLVSAMRCSTAAWKLHHCGPRPVLLDLRIDAIASIEKRGAEEPNHLETVTVPAAHDRTDAHNWTATESVSGPVVFPTNVKKRVTGRVQLFFRRLLRGKGRDNAS